MTSLDSTRRLAYEAARRYVAGRTLDEALVTIRRLTASGFGVSMDWFGEGLADPREATTIVDGYRRAAAAVTELQTEIEADVYLEIVPSHLGLDFGVDVCRRHVEQIVEVLPAGSRLEISAEESARTPRIIDLTVSLAAQGAAVMATVQANLRRSTADVDRLCGAGVPVRLVKGAYVESRDVAYPWGEPTDLAYVRLAHRIHDAGAQLALGAHDPVIREALLRALPGATVEMLLGVREDDARRLVHDGHRVRIYVPYGEDWFRYWMRRVAEARGA